MAMPLCRGQEVKTIDCDDWRTPSKLYDYYGTDGSTDRIDGRTVDGSSLHLLFYAVTVFQFVSMV